MCGHVFHPLRLTYSLDARQSRSKGCNRSVDRGARSGAESSVGRPITPLRCDSSGGSLNVEFAEIILEGLELLEPGVLQVLDLLAEVLDLCFLIVELLEVA